MNYLVVFANPEHCAKQGVPVTWHPHRMFDTLKEARASAGNLDRPNIGMLVRIHRLKEVWRSSEAAVAQTARAAA